jgi:hypothetical protein
LYLEWSGRGSDFRFPGLATRPAGGAATDWADLLGVHNRDWRRKTIERDSLAVTLFLFPIVPAAGTPCSWLAVNSLVTRGLAFAALLALLALFLVLLLIIAIAGSGNGFLLLFILVGLIVAALAPLFLETGATLV